MGKKFSIAFVKEAMKVKIESYRKILFYYLTTEI